MSKTTLFSIKLTAVTAIVVGAILIKYNSLSPYEFYVIKSRNFDEAGKPVKFIHQGYSCIGDYLVFFVNERGSLMCAIIEEKHFSYNLVRVCEEMPLPANDKSVNLSFIGVGRRDYPFIWLGFGIIIDASVAKILVADNEIAIVEADGLRLCYYSVHADQIPKESMLLQYELYDEQGRLIPRDITPQ